MGIRSNKKVKEGASLSFPIRGLTFYILERKWHLLEKLCDVLAAALGPGPGVGVVVEGGSHDMVLVLHA